MDASAISDDVTVSLLTKGMRETKRRTSRVQKLCVTVASGLVVNC